ncbi:MAG: murein transglycosylase A [Saezia sp.]
MLCKQFFPPIKTSLFTKLLVLGTLVASLLLGCTTPVVSPDVPLKLPSDYNTPDPAAKTIQTQNSRWVPAAWADLPGWSDDQIGQAWQAWTRSCAQFSALWIQECGQLLHLAQASENTKRQWMYDHLRPYRIESLQGEASGLLTAYYEPIFRAQRKPVGAFQYPLYYAPPNLHPTKPYWTRKEIESYAKAKQELENFIFAYLDDPLDVLILHIQGSGQLILTEPDGTTRIIRAAYAANNNHRYQSVGRYLLNKNLITDGSWGGIKSWLDQNPDRRNEVLWANPRYIFFREEELSDPLLGPLGAQGVPLSYGRSIAVDKTSIPYGTPVWIASEDPAQAVPGINKLVLAQDTGTAIVGAVRADYFWGKGLLAGEQAGRTKQTLHMWAFLPRTFRDNSFE